MNTNEPEPVGLPQGWPDVGTIERLANQFFQAPPAVLGAPPPIQGAPPAIPATDSLDPLTPLGGTTAPAVGLPSEGELHELLARFVPATGPVPQVAAAPYYFLEYAAPELPSAVVPPSITGREPLDVLQIRRDFPILQERVNARPLIWLDNAATTQKPQSVIDRLKHFYEHENSNIHRAAHELAARATDAYEQAREKVRGFLNASSAKEIVFVRGATEAINLVAQSWGRQHIGPGDEILITWLEHHANIVPWQQLATEKGARLKVVRVDESGQVLMDAYGRLLGPRTKLVSFTQVSNALGIVTPAKQIIEGARSVGAKVLLDGAQAVSHMRIDVQDLNPDWYVFSGHKVFAPTGIGVLYGKEELLNEMQPWQDVTFERTTYQPAPLRFEAGTGNIGDAVGLEAAIDYASRIGMERIGEHEHQLILYATRLLKEIPGLRLIGTAPDKAGVLSFVMDGHRTEDVGSALNQEGIAVRAGHHCAQPILRRFGVESTVRPSLALYNTCADIDALVAALSRMAGGRNPSLIAEGRS
jgi:cysteine desulfurase / selenocysteine lyase